MIIVTLRTDKPEAELGLFENENQLTYLPWQAHRQLAETIHVKLKELLESQNKTVHDVQGIVVFKGPGSFTGLRIGLSVANALAESLRIPIIGGNSDDWIKAGIRRLKKGENDQSVLPEYDSAPHTTKPNIDP